ncbi:MAG: AAA domain-containing protein [Polyangiaceae bacterium]|nr:AAA domain-containing protein [Polyangiaceae bacterium]
MKLDPARFDAAAQRFRRFFEELGVAFVERSDVLTQVALGLLAREHVLLAGPPGTAKSQIASSVFGRVVCEESGKPSLYARQITESTVQTDLIGPVDFKNLMESGRTTHFTDEGMLGASHAFLDEVFDGRDMLLRSALNVLQERELKEGTAIKKGRIECALMTSNRYVSEIVDQSRETLLAFLDRIAFVGFVPRGFANPENLAAVLRRNVGGTGKPRLDALLTLQDLDVLQAAVEDVYVAPEICDGLAKLLDSFDAEVAAASRADPAFSPTRYISTRTAVRSGAILRAIAVYAKIFKMPGRTFEVVSEDLALLRLHLVLSGPTPTEIEKLLAREVDPLERRQLTILRTEREIFDTCYQKLEPIRPSARPRREVVAEASAEVCATATPAPSTEQQARAERETVLRQIADASAAGDQGSLIALAKRLAGGTREGGQQATTAREDVERVVSSIGALALRRTLAVADPTSDPIAAVRSLASLATALEDGTASMHPTASWAKARALALIEDVAAHAGGPPAELFSGDADAAWSHVDRRIEALESLARIRNDLSAGSSTSGLAEDDDDWQAAIAKAEAELAAALAQSFAEEISRALKSADGSLGPVLGALVPELTRLDRTDARIAAFAGRPGAIKKRVAGARIGDLVRAALLRGTGSDRAALVDQIRGLLSVLGEHGLASSLEPAGWLAWTADALVQREPSPPKPKDAPSREAYFELRGAEQRTPITCTLAEVALLVSPEIGTGVESASAGRIASLLEALPAEVRTRVRDLDVGRAERSVGFLERWWNDLEPKPLAECVDAGAFRVFWDDAALARIAMEARLVEELLPSAGEAARSVRSKVDALAERVRKRGVTLLEERAEATWRDAMGGA